MTRGSQVKKIAVQKHDEASFVVEQVLDAKEEDIVLSLPKLAKFSDSESNFRLLRRQAELLGKQVSIETVDDDAIALAEAQGIEARNPFFQRAKRNKFSDILVKGTDSIKPRQHEEPEELPEEIEEEELEEPEEIEEIYEEEEEGNGQEAVPTGRQAMGNGLSDDEEGPAMLHDEFDDPSTGSGRGEDVLEHEDSSMHMPRTIDDGRDGDEDELRYMRSLSGAGFLSRRDKRSRRSVHHGADSDDVFEEEVERVRKYSRKPRRSARRSGMSAKRWLWLLGALLLLALLLYLALAVFPRAEITLDTEKTEWGFADGVKADKDTASVQIDTAVVPAELFRQKLNRSFEFVANGEEYIERKASGRLKIFNAFDDQEQQLVSPTRFQTTDGKIFRITEDVVVPGAKIENGKIVASSIEVDVVADEAGEDYNLSSSGRLSIPGFADTPRFDGFYGELVGSTTGGFVGTTAVASAEDVERGAKEAQEILEGSAASLLRTKIPEEFIILEDGFRFSAASEKVQDKANDKGMFNIFLEGESEQLVFREEDVLRLLEERAREAVGEEYEVYETSLDYTGADASFEEGTLTLSLDYQAQLRRRVDLESLQTQFLGKSEEELKSIIAGIDGVSRADVSLWPFWVKSVPADLEKLEVNIQ